MIKAAARAVFVAVVLAGCQAREVGEADPASRHSSALDRPRLRLPGEASAQVSRMLYEQNLISDPEVNREMNEAVLRITKGGASPDSVMPRFCRWLERWASTHPARVDAARLAGAYTSEARRMYADTHSSRKVQTDSIRRLVEARARRRREASLHSVAGHD